MDSRFQSVFLIKTPLQYLNALEALSAFDLKAARALLILMADKKSLPQLQSLVRQEHGWGLVVQLLKAPLLLSIDSIRRSSSAAQRPTEPIAPFSNALFAIKKLRRLAASLPPLRQIVLGDMGNPLMRHFANCAQAESIILLDDGVATLKYARERIEAKVNQKPLRRSKRIKLQLKRAALGLKDQPLASVTFFSVYDIQVDEADRYVRNGFDALRRQACKVDQDERIYFLGSPLVEAGILSEDECVAQLTAVNNSLAGSKPVLYVAHRRESPERVARLCEQLGWRSQLFDYPIEYQLAIEGPKPAVLASFISSALPNCRLVFGDTLHIQAFRLVPEHFAKQTTDVGERIAAVYREYEQLSGDQFEVVEL